MDAPTQDLNKLLDVTTKGLQALSGSPLAQKMLDIVQDHGLTPEERMLKSGALSSTGCLMMTSFKAICELQAADNRSFDQMMHENTQVLQSFINHSEKILKNAEDQQKVLMQLLQNIASQNREAVQLVAQLVRDVKQQLDDLNKVVQGSTMSADKALEWKTKLKGEFDDEWIKKMVEKEQDMEWKKVELMRDATAVTQKTLGNMSQNLDQTSKQLIDILDREMLALAEHRKQTLKLTEKIASHMIEHQTSALEIKRQGFKDFLLAGAEVVKAFKDHESTIPGIASGSNPSQPLLMAASSSTEASCFKCKIPVKGAFCSGCGQKQCCAKPAGTGKFCSSCGAEKGAPAVPVAPAILCCGTPLEGKFARFAEHLLEDLWFEIRFNGLRINSLVFFVHDSRTFLF